MMHREFHGATLPPPPLFSGAAFMSSQASQIAGDPSSPLKNRGPQGCLPLTAKQIAGAYHSGDDKSEISLDGVCIANVRLVGLVMNKVEKVTDVSFTLDDGTGRIDICRWINEPSDANEMAAIQNEIYVKIHGHLKGFQSKRHAVAFSVRPVIDFNEIVLHFMECIYVDHEIKKAKFSAHASLNGSGNNICNMVLGAFQDPVNLSREQGLHVDELVRNLRLPKNTIMNAINYLVNLGHIYSTIDEYHFKSAYSG